MNDQHPEGLPDREPETFPKFIPVNPNDLPEGLFDTIMRGISSEINHQQLHRFESKIAHSENEDERRQHGVEMFKWTEALSSSELRDTLRYAIAGLATAHQMLHERSRPRRIWRFIKSIVLDPGSWILSAVVLGFAAAVWVLA